MDWDVYYRDLYRQYMRHKHINNKGVRGQLNDEDLSFQFPRRFEKLGLIPTEVQL